jgi:hypothetical protein
VLELQTLLERNYVPSRSPMIRREVLQDIPAWYEHAPFGDWPQYDLAAERGAIGFLPQVMGAHRLHDQGLWSGAPRWWQLQQVVRFMKHCPAISHRSIAGARARSPGLLEEIRPGRRAWHFDCAAACALLLGSKRSFLESDLGSTG